jgi:uncharacterized tellurite resistance protein B-like protein
MSSKNLMMALAKVVIAAAWADGQITLEETNSLKDLFFRLPQVKSKRRIELTSQDWATLELYLHAPIDGAERARLIEELRAMLAKPQDKELAMLALGQMVQADRVVTEAERAVEAEIKTALENVDIGLIAQLSQLIRGPVQRRTQAVATAPNREDYLDDFIKNKVFFALRQRLHVDGKDLGLSEAELRKLSMAGGLMARVAHVDSQVAEPEFNLIVQALKEDWGISHEAATFVAEVAVAAVTPSMDYFRLTREFAGATTRTEQERFLDVLFDVAAADGKISHYEREEIRSIAQSLTLPQKSYLTALRTARQRHPS